MAISLKSLQKGKSLLPPRIVLYGPGKIGKSTWASQSPNPVFIPTEDGLSGIDTTKFPVCKTYDEAKEAVLSLRDEPHEFQTAVVDSADWLETLIFKKVADLAGKKHIGDIGYQKGYADALDYWDEYLGLLDELRAKRGMAVIVIAHHLIKKFDPPDAEGYDRYEIKLHKHSMPLLIEWSDIVAFANYKVQTKSTGKDFSNNDKFKALGSGERILHLQPKPMYTAGNRFNLPESLPFLWADFSKALNEATK